MKSLIQYIKEQKDTTSSKILINIDIADLDSKKDIKAALKDMSGVDVVDNDVNILDSATDEQRNKILDVLKEFSTKESKSAHRTNSESYATTVKKFEKRVNEYDELINPAEEDTENQVCPKCGKEKCECNNKKKEEE